MAKETVEMQMACGQYQEPLDVEESLFIQEVGDFRQSYMDSCYIGCYHRTALVR